LDYTNYTSHLFFNYILLPVSLGPATNFLCAIDPITVSIIMSAFLSLSKPIGGPLFGIAFWNISKVVSYERNIKTYKTYMIISGWGMFLIFAANQTAIQIVSPLSSIWAYNYHCIEHSRIPNVAWNLQFSFTCFNE
jgi:hypothetical protein